MDSAGKNRYELLFMDDDVSDPLDNLPTKKKQQQPQQQQQQVKSAVAGASSKPVTAATAKAQPGSNKKQPNQAEKENKPSVMNKNEANKRGAVATGVDKINGKQQQTQRVVDNVNRKRNAGPPGGAAVDVASQGRNASFRQQNGETREQRNNRRNTRENGLNNAGAGGTTEGGQQRQFRDRVDNRGPPRQRNFEGGNNYNREFRGKREFDRQSGSDKTGVKSVDKREGAGAHNWGSVKDDIDDGNKVNDTNAEGANAATEKAEDSSNEQQAEQISVEEETKELTLDEWKAQKQQRVKPQFNIRKAGEGEDTSQWKKMVALNNTKKKENESEEEFEYDPAMYPQRVGRQQRVLDIQFNFNDGRRGGGGFGGRGRARGGPRPDGVGSRSGPGAGERGTRGEPSGDRSFAGGSGPGSVGGGTGAVGAQRGGFEGSRGGRGGFDGARGGRGGFDGPRGGRGGLGVGKPRNFGGDSQQHAAPKVNDERQFPTLA